MKKRFFGVTGFVFGVLVLAAAVVSAHDFWLVPTLFSVKPGAKVAVALNTGDTFPASESAVKVANEAVQALGGAGYTKDWPVERFYRDAKLLDIGAGTNEIRRMLIGRELVGS